MRKEIIVNSLTETENIALKIGKNLKGGECFEFVSDLGGGKTTFICSLVQASGSKDSVSSPTFTISKVYKNENFNIYHFDFYRLSDAGLVAEELSECTAELGSVILVEWADTVRDVLPRDRVIIIIDKMPKNPESRKFVFEIPEKFKYLLEGIE